jgi:phosphoserine aminotransferase
MNVVFRVAGANGQSAATNPDEAAEKEFGKQAAAAGLVGTPGHRSVGGLRVSLYNAVEPSSVEALASFMLEFQRKRG